MAAARGSALTSLLVECGAFGAAGIEVSMRRSLSIQPVQHFPHSTIARISALLTPDLHLPLSLHFRSVSSVPHCKTW